MRGARFVSFGALLLALAACGGNDSATPTSSGPPAMQTPTGPPPSPAGGTDRIAGSVTPNFGKKPTIVVPTTAPPTRLLSKDIVAGTGKVVGEASTVTAQLIGVHWQNGHPFYSSWDKTGGAPDSFSLRDVIVGFAKGVAGMREGGRREIVIPPTLAYGSKGSGQVGPNETLVFVVDLIKIA